MSGGNCRLDGIDDPPRTKKFVANMEYVMSNPILMSSQAMAKDLHPVGETPNIQEVTPAIILYCSILLHSSIYYKSYFYIPMCSYPST
jgi:hypothetical protein